MAKLSDILYKVGLLEVRGNTDIHISGISLDSRQVEKGHLFVAIKGTAQDGHAYIENAIGSGAVAIVCQALPGEMVPDVTYLKVDDSAIALSVIADNFYENPSSEIQLVGVTGTNGKTTVATLLYRLFEDLGYSCGLISTVRNVVHQKEIKSTHTTPDAISINSLLKEMVDAGCTYCFMEVSSHAIAQKRVEGLRFSGGIFTNITHEHLDYHETFKAYINVKKRFFDDLPDDSFALVNADDKRAGIMLQNTRAKKHSFSLHGKGDFNARILENTFEGLVLFLGNKEIHTLLTGAFNASNLLAVFAAAQLLDADSEEVLMTLSKLRTAEGRFEQYISASEKIIGIIDYAHTPDALSKVLETIAKIRTGAEQLITVVGCGGDRDKSKRPVMARVACEFSNKVILTSDNPRSENPESIIAEMKAGVLPPNNKKLLSITDRRSAIETACQLARHGDIILVAGKGHEKYQETNGNRIPFDDKEILLESFKTMQK